MIRLRVPATSANLGPGFDCLGLALDLMLEVQATPSGEDHFHYRGEGSLPDTPHNLMHQGFRAAFAEAGQTAPRISFEVRNPIPLARGLGSSSAALVAGAAAADALMNRALGQDGLFQLCARMEGHPDNVGPAIYGGFTASARHEDGSYLCRMLEVPPNWHFLFGVPDFELLTSEARAVLPEHYPRQDVIFSSSRTALWALAIARNEPELLRVASQDVLHEPYREPLVAGLAACRRELLGAGAYAAFLSGAGPSVGVICGAGSLEACHELLQRFVGPEGRVLELRPGAGYRVQTLEVNAPVPREP